MENENKIGILEKLDSDQLFWFLIVKWLLITFTVLIISAVGCTVQKRETMSSLIQSGVNPILAHCAVYKGDVENDSICILEIGQSKGE